MQAEDDELLLHHGERGVGKLYDLYSKQVFRLAYALLRNVEDARDATQDTFMTLWRKRHEVTLLDGSVLPWLLTTARLTALAARRQRDRRALRSIPLDDVNEPTNLRVDDIDAVRDALAGMPNSDLQVLTLILIEGRSYAEASQALGISIAATGKRLERARLRFRTTYSGLLGLPTRS